MKAADHTIDTSKASVPWLAFAELVVAGEVLVRRVRRLRIVAALGWGVALALAAALLLGCSAPPTDTEPEPDPDACPEVPAAEVPLPVGCEPADCGVPSPLARCTRDYRCESRPGVCIRGWSCACAGELAECLGDVEAPRVCGGL